MDLKLGKKPARHDPRDLRFTTYINRTTLPIPPVDFGHEALVRRWGMLGNDRYGDCVLAGADHEHMLWERESDDARVAIFTADTALADYSAITGFNKDDPSTDQGTDMRAAANYRRATGMVDKNGKRHPIAGYMALDPGNVAQARQAAWIFSAVGVGFQFPNTAMAQFNAGLPWSVVPGATIEGGHYVPFVGFHAGLLAVVTWGKVQLMTPDFFGHYSDESFVYLDVEMLDEGKTLEGFDLATLQADLAAL